MTWERAPRFVHGDPDAERTLRPCAYGLICDDQGRLAVVRAPDGVFLPGGGIEPGETPEQAVVRESLEECGWDVRVGKRVAVAIQLTPLFEKPSSFYRIAIDAARRAPIEPGHETLWLAPDAAAATLTHESHSWAVRVFVSDETATDGPPRRRIVDFHQDDEGHWVADLECGHTQHVRHDPPWQVRPWVLTVEGRAGYIGVSLPCVHCNASSPR